MVARDITEITDIITTTIMLSVESTSEISNCQFNIIIIIIILTVCALENLFLMVTVILTVESALLTKNILICGYYCWRRRKKSKNLNKSI